MLATSRVPRGIRGALNQWMVEVLPGVYVGRPSARVRGHLWEALVDAFEFEEDSPYAALIYHAESEQGFTIERIGEHRYEVADFDGLQLVTVRHQAEQSDDEFGGLSEVPW